MTNPMTLNERPRRHVDLRPQRLRVAPTPVPAMAAPCIMKKLHRASAPVTQMLAVGEPMNGNMPSRLQNRMNRNSVHRNGTYLSASCPGVADVGVRVSCAVARAVVLVVPVARGARAAASRFGRAIWSRTNVSSDSKRFHQRPVGSPPSRMRRASGMKMAGSGRRRSAPGS